MSMEARTSSFDEVTRPNQMLDSTAATALKNILPLKHRHLVQEEHPYTQYVFSKVRCDYMNDVKNRNQQEEGIVSKLVSRVSLHDVHAFRQETLKSLNEYSFPIGTDAKQTDLLKCFETRPEEISGLYYIVKRRKTDLLLCAVHREMAAEDRHDLKVVKLTPEATDVLNEGRVRLENYYVGDVVLVFTMTPTCVRSRILEVDPISTFKDDFAPSWSVRKFGLVHRNIEQILAAPLEVDKKKGTILLTGENKTRLVHGKLDQFPADFKMDQVFEVSVLVPLEHCERLTTHYRDPENIRIIQAKLSDMGSFPTLPINLIRVWERSEAAENAFKNIQNVFTSESFEKGLFALFKGMQFSQPALTAIDARLQDSYAYLSSVRVTRNPLDSTLSVDLFSSAGIPQASAWTCGKKVHVTLPGPVKLVGVVSESWKLLLLPVEIRLSKDQYELNEDFFESHKPEVLIQQVDQRQDPVTNYWIHQKLAAFEKVKEDDALSIWTRALFAGRAYDFQINEDPEVITVIKRKKTVELTREQAVYVDTFLKGAKALIGSSSFGCGKSLTIAVAADRRAQMDDGLHLMLAATNYATANLTWMSSDIEDDHSRPLLRLITENNRKMVPDASKTFYDSPEVIVEVFHEYLTKLDTRFFNKEYPVIDFRKNEVVLGYLQSRKAFRYNELRSKYVRRMVAKQWPAADPMRTIDVFLELSNTGRICATIGTALAHFCNVWRSHAERVMSVQIDESSQLKLSEFIALLNLFPSAQFSLVGDKNQLPPFSPIETPQLIEKLAIGEILEDLERLGTVPRVEFNGVFRCPPDITQMLSKNFYDDRLWSVKDRYYQSFFIKRFGMWPNREFHVTFVDHDYESWLRGYTRVCPDEMRFALELAARIGDEDPKAKVAILALYRGQADLLQVCCDAYLPVFTGTVDSCQGREFDVVIILTTRSGEEAHPSEFLGCPKRINVAMSRAKEAVFIVGSEADLIELPHWRRILDEIHRQDAFTSVDDYFSSWRLSRRDPY